MLKYKTQKNNTKHIQLIYKHYSNFVNQCIYDEIINLCIFLNMGTNKLINIYLSLNYILIKYLLVLPHTFNSKLKLKFKCHTIQEFTYQCH